MYTRIVIGVRVSNIQKTEARSEVSTPWTGLFCVWWARVGEPPVSGGGPNPPPTLHPRSSLPSFVGFGLDSGDVAEGYGGSAPIRPAALSPRAPSRLVGNPAQAEIVFRLQVIAPVPGLPSFLYPAERLVDDLTFEGVALSRGHWSESGGSGGVGRGS